LIETIGEGGGEEGEVREKAVKWSPSERAEDSANTSPAKEVVDAPIEKAASPEDCNIVFVAHNVEFNCRVPLGYDFKTVKLDVLRPRITEMGLPLNDMEDMFLRRVLLSRISDGSILIDTMRVKDIPDFHDGERIGVTVVPRTPRVPEKASSAAPEDPPIVPAAAEVVSEVTPKKISEKTCSDNRCALAVVSVVVALVAIRFAGYVMGVGE